MTEQKYLEIAHNGETFVAPLWPADPADCDAIPNVKWDSLNMPVKWTRVKVEGEWFRIPLWKK